ncbi:hypothetical protein JEP40_04825 [Proteus vulgaris]|uniref:hypothetical protein n=1 Tax=Proteus vulgaris TaxID=585 RepID=UPI0018E46653|nr:hypothetical protein [Proteus vulgaris]MBI6528460.1 hypothetical protein [Proteus vulgaris]
MAEYFIHKRREEDKGKTTAGGQVTPVSVSISPAKLFMEARSLSYASPKSIILPKPIFKPTPVPYQSVLDAVKDVAIASRWGILGLLFHSEPAGDPNEDQLFIGRLINSPLLVGGFSRSSQTVKGQNYTEEVTLRQLAHKKAP